MTNQIDQNAFLSFFSGKAREKAAVALALLIEDFGNKSWRAGNSRSVPAALTKHNVAAKFVKDWGYRHEIYMAMTYGGNYVWPFKTDDELLKDMDSPRYDELKAMYRSFVAAARPVMEMVHYLNSVRPAPVMTSMGASPTVTKTLEAFNATDVQPCPVEEIQFERRDDRGLLVWSYTFLVLKWPPGTVHGQSRFSSDDCQCEACGHGIKTNNWCPLVLTTPTGPSSLWVGRDCARTLFGVTVKGGFKRADEQKV